MRTREHQFAVELAPPDRDLQTAVAAHEGVSRSALVHRMIRLYAEAKGITATPHHTDDRGRQLPLALE